MLLIINKIQVAVLLHFFLTVSVKNKLLHKMYKVTAPKKPGIKAAN
jgi:hypothetical protein